jgi:hypothetical protein
LRVGNSLSDGRISYQKWQFLAHMLNNPHHAPQVSFSA